jgi:probable DNA repair protein
LVVPSVQRAAALRLAYGVAELERGMRTWATPRVLAWNAWLEHGLDEARARGVAVPRRLAHAESWWLWREAVRAACVDEFEVLWPDGLVDPVRRATLLLEDFGLALRAAATAEAAVLARAQSHFAASCRARAAIWSSSWRACADYIALASPTRLAGFDELGPARLEWLQTLGTEARPAVPQDPAAAAQVRPQEDPEQEAMAAAHWCAGELERDPRARLLLIVPRLSEQRHLWLRALSQRLDAKGLIEGGVLQGDSGSVAVEGGEPLAAYALVSLAMQLLSLAAGELEFTHLSPVLRSPYLSAASREPRLAADAWLRQHNVELRGPELPALLQALAGAKGAAARGELHALLQGLDTASDAGVRRGSPADWARRFARTLQRAGWPGPELTSTEQQQRLRFEELLGEYAAVDTDSTLPPRQALALLRQLATNTAFEPATDDAPVTLTASLADPIASYDGIWVAGLTAASWPQAVRPDPMLPWGLQRGAGMPGADPTAPLREAERALGHWRAATGRLVLSYPRAEADLRHDPSSLLPGPGPRAAASGEAPPASAPSGLEAWLTARAPQLEAIDDHRGAPWPVGEALQGGARLLELQALCPFRAFAELRLGAVPLAEPSPGIDPMVRGQILHRALELFWTQLPDSRTLEARRAELGELARDCIELALREVERRVAGGLDPRLLRHEATRNARLIERLVEWELTRPPFAIEGLERAAQLAIGGAALRLRIDRIDRLPDGRLIVFDYKTGAAEPFNAQAERLRRPQLPAYAVTTGERTAAVTALYLTPQGLKLRGIADQDGRVPELRAGRSEQPAWEALLESWRAGLTMLVTEYLSGQARVDPLPNACDFCHLRLLCRIQPPPVTEPQELGPEPETP